MSTSGVADSTSLPSTTSVESESSATNTATSESSTTTSTSVTDSPPQNAGFSAVSSGDDSNTSQLDSLGLALSSEYTQTIDSTKTVTSETRYTTIGDSTASGTFDVSPVPYFTTRPLITTSASGSRSAATSSTTSAAVAVSGKDAGGLSSGAEAGIGAGIGLLVLALLITGAFLLVRRRRRTKREPRHSQLGSRSTNTYTNLEMSHVYTTRSRNSRTPHTEKQLSESAEKRAGSQPEP